MPHPFPRGWRVRCARFIDALPHSLDFSLGFLFAMAPFKFLSLLGAFTVAVSAAANDAVSFASVKGKTYDYVIVGGMDLCSLNTPSEAC